VFDASEGRKRYWNGVENGNEEKKSLFLHTTNRELYKLNEEHKLCSSNLISDPLIFSLALLFSKKKAIFDEEKPQMFL
jgi:hypothetical protein